MKPDIDRRSDRVGSLIWIGLGLTVVYFSWTMDRLEQLHINPLTVPGLVPGLLGLALMIFGAVLAWRSFGPRSAGPKQDDMYQEDVTLDRHGLVRVSCVAFLCLFYAAVLLGHGIPYYLSTAAFVFVVSLLIEWMGAQEKFQPLRGISRAALTSATVTILSIAVFERFLLLRLP